MVRGPDVGKVSTPPYFPWTRSSHSYTLPDDLIACTEPISYPRPRPFTSRGPTGVCDDPLILLPCPRLKLLLFYRFTSKPGLLGDPLRMQRLLFSQGQVPALFPLSKCGLGFKSLLMPLLPSSMEPWIPRISQHPGQSPSWEREAAGSAAAWLLSACTRQFFN